MKELQTALNYENQGILLYTELCDKFECEIFNQILEIKKAGMSLLENAKTDENMDEILPPVINSKKEGIYLALSYEEKSSQIYDELTNSVEDGELKDLFFRLWATSENEYKPALLTQLENLDQKSQNDDFNFDSLKQIGLNLDTKSINELNEILIKFKDGKASKKDINKFLQNPYFSFLSGAMLGAVGGILINQILKENENNENLE